MRSIIQSVSSAFDVSESDITGPRRHREITKARFAVVLLARQAGISYTAIAGKLGYSDHSPAVRAHERAQQLYEKEPGFRSIINKIVQEDAE